MDEHHVDSQDVLALVFENYYLLNDASEFGISETGSAPGKMSLPPALVPALSLLGTAASTLTAYASRYHCLCRPTGRRDDGEERRMAL